MRRNMVKIDPGGGYHQAVKEQEEPCDCDCVGDDADDSNAIKPTRTASTVGMLAHRSKIAPEGPQIEEGKRGEVRTREGIDRHGNWEQPNAEIDKEREELVYIDGVRGSSMHSAENSSNTVCRDGSVVDLNLYFLSYSTRNNHERVEEPFSIRFKEKPHIKHQIQNYLENCVHVQSQHTLESNLPQSQVKPPPLDGDGTAATTGLPLVPCDNADTTTKSQNMMTSTSQLDPSLMVEKHTDLRSIKEELEEIELKEVEILAEQAQLRRRKEKLLQNCPTKLHTKQKRGTVHKNLPSYHKHYYRSSVSDSGPRPQIVMKRDTECPSSLKQSIQPHELYAQMRHHQPHGTGGNGILVKTKGGEKGNELLSSAAMPSFSGIGLSEMELADVSTSNCGSSRKSIFTSVDTTSWGEGGGDDVQFPSSPCYSTLTSQTSLIIPRARYSSQASPASSQEWGGLSHDGTPVSSMNVGRIKERPFQNSNANNSKAAYFFSNRRRSAFMAL